MWNGRTHTRTHGPIVLRTYYTHNLQSVTGIFCCWFGFWAREWEGREYIRVAAPNERRTVLHDRNRRELSRMDCFMVCMVKINTNSEHERRGSQGEMAGDCELKMINYLAFINNREINYIFLTFFTGVRCIFCTLFRLLASRLKILIDVKIWTETKRFGFRFKFTFRIVCTVEMQYAMPCWSVFVFSF